MQETGSSGYVT